MKTEHQAPWSAVIFHRFPAAPLVARHCGTIPAEPKRRQVGALQSPLTAASTRFVAASASLLILAFSCSLFADAQNTPSAPPVNTFSIVAFDPTTGDLGIAVASKVLGVGSIVPWAQAHVGAIATQSAANTGYGPDGLKLLELGRSAQEVVDELTGDDRGRSHRQLGIVDAEGNAATFTGTNCNAWAGGVTGEHYAIQGNILPGEGVVAAMADAYETARQKEGSELADWLVAALAAGETAGGDSRGKQSASLLVVREKSNYDRKNDRYIDLRVEDNPEPVQELARLLEIHKQFYAGLHRDKPKRELMEK